MLKATNADLFASLKAEVIFDSLGFSTQRDQIDLVGKLSEDCLELKSWKSGKMLSRLLPYDN